MNRVILPLLLLITICSTLIAQTELRTRMIASNTEDWDGTLWVERDSSRIFFAEQLQDTARYNYVWNATDLAWRVTNRRINTFDAQGNRIENVLQTWDGTQYVNDLRQTSTFAADNLSTVYHYFNWNGTEWQPYSRSTTTYNAQGRIIALTSEQYVAGTWVNDSRTVYSYTGSGLLEIDQYQLWNTGTANWDNVNRIVYTYSPDAFVLTEVYQNWSSGAWENSTQYAYEYNDSSYVSVYNLVSWSGTVWDTFNRYVYTYNTQNQVLTNTRQTKSGGNWQDFSREVRTYNAAGLSDSLINQRWVGSNWESTVFYSAIYNSFGNSIYGDVYDWTNGAWVGRNRTYQYYETFELAVEPEDTTGVADLQNTPAVTAYPNPFADELHFKLPTAQAGPVQVTLYNLAGSRVLHYNQILMHNTSTITIQTSNLPRGGYIYILTIDGKQSRGLIAK